MPLSKFPIYFKALRQLGFTQVALYALYKAGLKTGYYKRVTDDRRPKTDKNGLPSIVHGLYTLPDRTQLAQILGKDGQRALLAEADEIVAGKFRIFGGEPRIWARWVLLGIGNRGLGNRRPVSSPLLSVFL